MKKIYRIFKMQLLLAVVLFGATLSFAQTVTVPSNCIVVSTNTTLGGVLGAGGKVTTGGVVTMADAAIPNGGLFTFAGPAGVTLGPLISWNLIGDLSSAVTVPNYGSPLQPANGTTATIISYNKFLRPTEGLAPSIATWARSKGKVTVGYTTNLTLCPGVFIGGNVTFDIFKRFTATPVTNVPKIVGPECVDANKQCTFSVDQIVSDNANDNIGFDKYYWNGVPITATNIYYSADNSSITFTPATTAAFTLNCCIGKANSTPWSDVTNNGPLRQPFGYTYTTCVSKTVGAAPSEPTYLTTGTVVSTIAANAPCVPTGTTALPATFTINYTSSNTCTWTAANTGWEISAQTAGSVTINTKGFNNPGILTLSVSNGSCTSLTFQYQINRSFVANAVSIVPPTADLNCLEANSTTNFSISTSAATNPTTWSISPTGAGVTLNPSTPNSTVAVNVGANPTVGLYTLTAKSTNCAGNITYQFRVKPKLPTITGTPCVIKGATGTTANQTYTCAATTGSTYTWVFPAGWQPTTGNFVTATNTITVTPTSATAVLDGIAIVTADGVATCNTVSPNFAINYASVAPTSVTAGCFSVGIAGTASVTFANPIATGSYYGTLTATGSSVNSIVGTAVNLTIAGVITNVGVLLNSSVAGTLSFSTSALLAGTYSLKIYHDNGCGDAVFSTTSITVAGNSSALVLAPGNPTDNYFATPGTGVINAQYEWTVCTPVVPATIPPTFTCTSVGGNSPLLQLSGATAPPAGNQVCVNVFPFGSTCKTRICAAQGARSRMANTVIKGETLEGVTIYPNPNSGNFNIRVIDFKKEATATLYDATGKKLKDFDLNKGENKIENEGLAHGNYFMVISVDDKTDVKQIIIK